MRNPPTQDISTKQSLWPGQYEGCSRDCVVLEPLHGGAVFSDQPTQSLYAQGQPPEQQHCQNQKVETAADIRAHMASLRSTINFFDELIKARGAKKSSYVAQTCAKGKAELEAQWRERAQQLVQLEREQQLQGGAHARLPTPTEGPMSTSAVQTSVYTCTGAM